MPEEVKDRLEEQAEESGDVSTDEQTDGQGEEKEEASQPLEDDATSEDSDGKQEEEGSLEVEDFLEDESDEKSGVQRRIDQLTAEKKSAQEKNEALQQHISDLENKMQDKNIDDLFPSDMPDYSPEQLNEALEKAVTEGDSRLINEIMDYKVKKGQKDAFKLMEKQRKQQAEEQQRKVQEWQSIVQDFSDYGQNDSDLDITNNQSLLHQLANKLYTDTSRKKRYQRGGQRQAVMDALNLILKKRRGDSGDSGSSKQTKNLEKRLAKEKRKSTVANSSKAMKKQSSSPKKKTSKQKLDEYLEERRIR